MKNIGLLIAFVGMAIVGGSLILTPQHAFNPVDSDAGLGAAAAIFFGGILVFGAGVVMYANSVMPKSK